MKQRIRVTAICECDGKLLFLKRASGRIGLEMGYELPTGKIAFGEQPDEAMSRVIYENTGVRIDNLRLEDVVTFVNMEHSSEMGNLYVVYRVKFADEMVRLCDERHVAYRWAEVQNESPEEELDEASSMVLSIVLSKSEDAEFLAKRGVSEPNSGNLTMEDVAIVYTDGGSRGNPGPSGAGYYILDNNGREIKRGGIFLGFSSSRLAEYYGLKEGLEQVIELGYKKAHFRSDSLMLVNQMNGVYKVKNRDLLQVYNDVLRLLGELEAYSFTHVPRSQNQEADAEVNKIIDIGARRGMYE